MSLLQLDPRAISTVAHLNREYYSALRLAHRTDGGALHDGG
ncbi:MAG: hypothetical protein U0X92_14015 [Anaerolineales bacterium]